MGRQEHLPVQRPAGRNWAGNLRYQAPQVNLPQNLAQLQQLVARSAQVRVVGSRHSFNEIADTPHTLISLDHLPHELRVDRETLSVRVNGALRYGTLAQELQAQGYALHNLASLPHISVAGAVATGTHGSGDRQGNLATAVRALSLVLADGSLKTVRRGDAQFPGMVVNLGALGVVSHLELQLQPDFAVRQQVVEDLEWEAVLADFTAVTSSAYSVSLFTDWRGTRIGQGWFKHRVAGPGGSVQPELYGGRLATLPRHPLPGIDGKICTTQLNQPGPWSRRLAHFRMDFTPSAGAELQSEYLIPREHAVAALDALRELTALISPLLLVSEIRTVAADELWLSGSYQRESVAVHFTWRPDQPAVMALLPVIEAALAPYNARPHWGKLFTVQGQQLRELYPRAGDFLDLAAQLDPAGKFSNQFLKRTLQGR